MKWYYWVLAVPAAIFVYELTRKFGRRFVRTLWLLLTRSIHRAVIYVVVRSMQQLRKLHRALQPAAKASSLYAPLTPTDKADSERVYEQVLLSGIDDPQIQNIALCGPYGAGKTSIIRTFMRAHPEYRYLSISLAAVSNDQEQMPRKEDPKSSGAATVPLSQKATTPRPGTTGTQADSDIAHEPIDAITRWSAQLSEQIEYSILQQMFYHVRDRHIPYSRFKRVKGTSRMSLLLPSLALFGILLAASYLFLVGETTPLPADWKTWLNAQDGTLGSLCWLVLLGSLFGVIYFALKFYRNAQLIKINVHSTQVEIAPQKNFSALNKHLDEILYYFTEVPIDIVIIEDLDRFKNPEIFVKLREINALINNAQEVGRKVTFIYALRDDVFNNEDRTKFFDLIAPVIPVTNASNAAAKLHEAFCALELPSPMPESLLDDLGFFIQDTRLLLNITNEFRVYQQLLDDFEVDYGQLLAVIVYKNRYPSDFVKLQYNEGDVYSFFEQRPRYIRMLTAKLEMQRKDLEDQIEAVRQNHLKSIKELRMVFLAALFREIHKRGSYGFNGHIRQGSYKQSDLTELTKDEAFKQLREANRLHIYSSQNEAHEISVNFTSAEQSLGQNYESRERALMEILDQDQEALRKQLENTEQEITRVRHYTMQQIMARPEMADVETPIRKYPVLAYLVSAGYLTTDYRYYLSRFTEGELSRDDFDFIRSVKDRKAKPWDHPLSKLPALVRKLDEREFAYPEMLNFDLAEYLVTGPLKDAEMHQLFMAQLGILDLEAARFIDQYVDRGAAVPAMITAISKYIPGFWTFLETQSRYTSDKINKYLQQMLQHADPADMAAQNENGLLRKYLGGQPWLLAPAEAGIETARAKTLIATLQVQFDLPDGEFSSEPEMIDYLHAHDHYVLNPRMVSFILAHLLPDYNEAAVLPAQYTCILQSDLHQLKAYIELNFNHYVADVFLKIKPHYRETDITVLKILNSDNVQLENKKKVVSDTEFLLPDINACKDRQVWDGLLEHQRIAPTWENVHHYFSTEREEDESAPGFNKTLADFLNNAAASPELSARQITEEEVEQAAMLSTICTTGALTDKALEHCIQAMAFQMKAVNFRPIGQVQAKMLLDKGKVAFELSTFNSLQQQYPHLAASWAIGYWEQYTEIFDQLAMRTVDWTSLFSDTRLSDEQRSFLLEKLPDDQVIPLLEAGAAIPDDDLEFRQVDADASKLLALAAISNVSRNSVALILASQLGDLEEEQVRTVLSAIGGDYALLAKGQAKIKVENSAAMGNLLDMLKTADHLVNSFESKSKYIHVILKTSGGLDT